MEVASQSARSEKFFDSFGADCRKRGFCVTVQEDGPQRLHKNSSPTFTGTIAP